MNSRTWIAAILCCIIWVGYIQWFGPKPTANKAIPPQAPPSKTSAPEMEAKVALPTVAKVADWVAVDNAVLTARKSPATGALSQVTLKKYTHGKNEQIELLDTQHFEGSLVPFLSTASDSLKKEVTVGERYLSKVKLVIDPTLFKGVTTLTLSIPLMAHDLVYDANTPLKSWEVLSYQSEKLTRKQLESLSEGEQVSQGSTTWIGIGNRYFTTLVVPRSSMNPDVVFIKDANKGGVLLRYPISIKEGAAPIEIAYDIYTGPKEALELAVVPSGKQIIDYGMFSFLAYPLLDILNIFYKFSHNYGIAIILLTILVRLLFYPLSVKSARSMKAMQKLQPQIQSLKERYKDDPQKFNTEQMALFKSHKVNPLGGCLPMLIQLPVFLALYAVLANSMELFHAPFFGWIQDLSSKDPYYVFPVLMGISMFVQQKMTPMAGMDPMQQKMMLFMPIIFSFIMINLPAGLTVYMFLSTVLGILQQLLINREHKPNSISTLVPASNTPKK